MKPHIPKSTEQHRITLYCTSENQKTFLTNAFSNIQSHYGEKYKADAIERFIQGDEKR